MMSSFIYTYPSILEVNINHTFDDSDIELQLFTNSIYSAAVII